MHGLVVFLTLSTKGASIFDFVSGVVVLPWIYAHHLSKAHYDLLTNDFENANKSILTKATDSNL